MNEAKIQQACFMWHWNTYPEQRMQLYANYNNPPNKIAGAMLKGQGLIAGVADLTYLSPKGLIYIEMKNEDGKQSAAQKEFQQKVELLGYQYHIIRSFNEFQNLIKSLQNES